MTLSETLTILTAIVSLVIALTSLVRTRKIAAEQLRLQTITAELSQKQIARINEEENLKTKADIRVNLVKLGTNYRFVIVNQGQGCAYKLGFSLLDCSNSPLCSDYHDKIPYPELRPNSSIQLFAAIYMQSPRTYKVELTWDDKNGNKSTDVQHVTL